MDHSPGQPTKLTEEQRHRLAMTPERPHTVVHTQHFLLSQTILGCLNAV